MSVAELGELIAVFLSSAGVLGAGLTGVLRVMLRRAKQDAEKQRAERISVELQRMEGEERLSEVVLALVRASREDSPELREATRAYGDYLEKRRRLRDEILSRYTVK